MTSCVSKAMGSLTTGVNLVIYATKFKTCNGWFIQRSVRRNFCIKCGSLDPPNVGSLAKTARIALTTQEVEDFGPKIQKVVDWFGQLQAVDLESIDPAIRSDIDDDNLREDLPQTFENREGVIASIPSYEAPYIKVPKVLNKE